MFLKSTNSDMENGFKKKNSKMFPEKFIYSGNCKRYFLKGARRTRSYSDVFLNKNKC